MYDVARKSKLQHMIVSWLALSSYWLPLSLSVSLMDSLTVYFLKTPEAVDMLTRSMTAELHLEIFPPLLSKKKNQKRNSVSHAFAKF